MKNQVEIQIFNLIEHLAFEEISENEIEYDIYKQTLGRDIIPNKRISINQSDSSFLSNKNENILPAFKINNIKFFSY